VASSAGAVRRRSRRDANPVEIASVEEIASSSERGGDPPASRAWRRSTSGYAFVAEIEVRRESGGDRTAASRAWRRSTSIASVEEIHQRQRVCGGDRGETRIRWRSNSSDANLHSGSSSGDPGGGGDERKGVRTRRAAACVLTCPCACADPNRTSGCRRRSLLLCAEIECGGVPSCCLPQPPPHHHPPRVVPDNCARVSTNR
jgi:hypothetical protein